MAVDLAKVAKEKKIKYFLISFSDHVRGVALQAGAGARDRRDAEGRRGLCRLRRLARHDPGASRHVCGSRPRQPDPAAVEARGRLAVGDLWMDGREVEASPRVMLKRQIEAAAKLGYRLKTGVECEYHLINEDGTDISDPRDIQSKPCYDQSALMRRYDVISEICDAMIDLGWNPYQNDHEDANGQFEMNWDYTDCLETADRHTFFKFMVKSIAENHGLRATFMPKPFVNLTGNGCHCHASLWDKTGKKNLFDGKDDMGLSKLAYDFLGGVMHSAEALCALFNPTINSYKRINAPRTLSGATWSPNTVTFGGNNRTHMVRIPDDGRFEFRLMDGAANPYLLQAGVLAAGLDGIAHKRDPGKRVDLDMYAEGHKVRGAKKLPLNLLDALRLFDKSKVLNEAFGREAVQSYVKLKMESWDDYCRHLTQWERDQTLDC